MLIAQLHVKSLNILALHPDSHLMQFWIPCITCCVIEMWMNCFLAYINTFQ